MRLIIVAGMPATGKSWIAGKLRDHFGLPVIEKDAIKESLFDTVGFESYEEKRALDVAANSELLEKVRRMAEEGRSLIVDNNFDEESARELGKLLEKYDIDCTTVFLSGDTEVLYKRYVERDTAHRRHLGHAMQTHYPPHEGESTEFSMSREGFAERFLRRRMDVMTWGGRRIDLDTTDFEKVDVEGLYLRIKEKVMQEDVLKMISSRKVIAIVRGVYGEDALRLAKALHEGGIGLLEVTFDQSSEEMRKKTLETIRLLNETLGGKMCFGAGTVTSVEMVRAAFDAGAKFIISPNTDAEVILKTRALGMVSVPGAFTPTEIFEAARAGADLVKVFPADVLGPSYFKSVLAPLNNVRLLAVGGVNKENIRAYLDAGAVGAGVASCLFRKEWIREGAWEKVTEAAKELMVEVEKA